MAMVIFNKCVFQNKRTKGYKWLSLESADGTNRYLYESRTDSVSQPSQRPSDGGKTHPATFNDYETARDRILSEGYVMVTQQ
jgi:hypothetical protein